MKDDLGDRMKSFYEDRTRISIPRRSYGIIRVDGKAFHTYTRNLQRPFDEGLIEDMQLTALELCKQIQGAKFAYTQSDEISIVFTDITDNVNSEMWFDGNIQKIASVAASIATARFNYLRYGRHISSYVDCGEAHTNFETLANFDARVFSISQRHEVLNYLLWRQNDASKNSIQMVARSLYSHKELEGKTSDEMQEMIFQRSGKSWNDLPAHLKRGSCIYKKEIVNAIRGINAESKDSIRGAWFIDKDSPRFNQNWTYLDCI